VLSAVFDNPERVLLPAILQSVANEKCAEFYDQSKTVVLNLPSSCYGHFSKVDAAALARVVSNLLNNALEASPANNNVDLSLGIENGCAVITVSDRGHGISAELLAKLGKTQIHSLKSGLSGSGLGVLYAQNFANVFNGELKFLSSAGHGTIAKLILPVIEAPFWFASSLELTESTTVVSLGLDERFSDFLKVRMAAGQNCLAFQTQPQFLDWARQKNLADFILFVDGDCQGFSEKILAAIEKLDLAERAVMLTNACDSKQVQAHAEYVGVKILPKNLAHLIPIHTRPTQASLNVSRVRNRFGHEETDGDRLLGNS
jgi:hypothetical protein